MKNEYTVTFTAEATGVFHGTDSLEQYLMSDEFKQDIGYVVKSSASVLQDVHVDNIKVFISKEDAE